MSDSCFGKIEVSVSDHFPVCSMSSRVFVKGLNGARLLDDTGAMLGAFVFSSVSISGNLDSDASSLRIDSCEGGLMRRQSTAL